MSNALKAALILGGTIVGGATLSVATGELMYLGEVLAEKTYKRLKANKEKNKKHWSDEQYDYYVVKYKVVSEN